MGKVGHKISSDINFSSCGPRDLIYNKELAILALLIETIARWAAIFGRAGFLDPILTCKRIINLYTDSFPRKVL